MGVARILFLGGGYLKINPRFRNKPSK